MSTCNRKKDKSRTRHQSSQTPREPKESLVFAPRSYSFNGVTRHSDNDSADADDEGVTREPPDRARGSVERPNPARSTGVEGWKEAVVIKPPPGLGRAISSRRTQRPKRTVDSSSVAEDSAPAPVPISGGKSSLLRSNPNRVSPDFSASCLSEPEDDTNSSDYSCESSSHRRGSAPSHQALGSRPFLRDSSRTTPQSVGITRPPNGDLLLGPSHGGSTDSRVVNMEPSSNYQENEGGQESVKRELSEDVLEVLESLGDPAGSVCRVQDRRNGRIMVRKTILTGTVPAQQVLHELQSTELKHQNLIVRHGAYMSTPATGHSSPEVHILTEFCEGRALDLIRQQMRAHLPNSRISEKALAHLVDGVLRGLNYMHENKVTHRGVNPSNIFVTRTGVAKLCDFGVSRNIRKSLAKTGWYRAPERIGGHSDSIKADVWSMGVTFLELAQNRLPHPPDRDPAPLFAQISSGKIPGLDDDLGNEGGKVAVGWDDEMKSFIKQCLLVDAATRPPPRMMLQHPWLQKSMTPRLDMARWIREVWGWEKPTKAERACRDADFESTLNLRNSNPQTPQNIHIDTRFSGTIPDRHPLDQSISGMPYDNRLRKGTPTRASKNSDNLVDRSLDGEAREIGIMPGLNRYRKNAVHMTSQTIPPQVDKPAYTQKTHSSVVSSIMTSAEIASVLTVHGCVNLTRQLDWNSCSPFAVLNGGAGDVYSGRLSDRTPVAIKVFRLQVPHDQGGKHLKHAAKELHTWSKCQHPNVLTLLGLVEFRGQVGMVSPWIAYGSILSYLNRWPGANRHQLCYGVCDGLAYLHGIRIAHGDLKGANVLVSDDGTPLLTDFGNSVLNDQSLQFTKTSDKSNISPRWTAPEVLEGLVPSSYSADVFSLGMTMLETITGNVPFHELTRDIAVCAAILNMRKVPPRPETHIPSNNLHGNMLWSLLEQCWAFEPNHRPSAEQARDQMLKIVNIAGSPPTLPQLLPPSGQSAP